MTKYSYSMVHKNLKSIYIMIIKHFTLYYHHILKYLRILLKQYILPKLTFKCTLT